MKTRWTLTWIVLAVLFLLSCTPKRPPNIDPKPKPEPEKTYPASLLRTDGAKLITVEQKPVKFVGCILCCPDVAPAGWPGINRKGIDECLAATSGRANYFEFRLGPYMSSSETEYSEIGGAYAEVNGKADLNNWNEKFWTASYDSAEYICSKGGWITFDLIDDWSKRNRANDDCTGGYVHPWIRGCNIQNEDGFGDMPRQLNDRQRAFIDKAVSKLGPLGCIMWQDGNEVGLDGNPGYDVEWTNSIRQYVTERELFHNVPEHLLITNAYPHDAAYNSLADGIAIHTNGESWPTPINGRFTLVNEYNPNPPMTPEALASMWCRAIEDGTIYVPWRHGMPMEDWLKALGLIAKASQNNCAGISTSGCPTEPPETRAIICKEHSSGGSGDQEWHLWDCTAKKPSGGDLWPEGNGAVRLACETKSMCGRAQAEACISFGLTNVVGDLRIVDTAHNGFGFILKGHGSADLTCSIPMADAHFVGCTLPDGSRRVEVQ
jgi:hypothetical protein